MLLARCYNNEGLERYVDIGQYVEIEDVANGIYKIYKRSGFNFLFYIETPNFEKHFEVIHLFG